jgi:hypothetical protein
MESEINQLMDCAVKINSILSSYIKIHDEMFKISLNRLIPIDGYFERVDFSAHLKNLEKISQELNQIENEIAKTKEKSVNELPLNFAKRLEQYSIALRQTVNHLKMISKGLHEKTKKPNHYEMKKYLDDMDKYQSLIDNYTKLGEEMNNFIKNN